VLFISLSCIRAACISAYATSLVNIYSWIHTLSVNIFCSNVMCYRRYFAHSSACESNRSESGCYCRTTNIYSHGGILLIDVCMVGETQHDNL
jgi:hypothetical protein